MAFVMWFIACVLSCSENKPSPDVSSKDRQQLKQQNGEVELWIKQWRADSVGCERLRNKAMAESIIDSLMLETAERIDFLKVFGGPNTTYQREENFGVGYYFDASCVKGNFIDSADRCVAEVTFNQNKLVQSNNICY